ncbi:FxSxx-COOH system tetratricopeptide repeat protein [Streptomyces sp. ODS28]|uniref:FxSxx-COOH system tetratricopeptide repeat protein n=1 Tax=Streptomyces sp. ODS28 TaxID=3136688 RepID=UPI0031EB216B
MPHFTISYAGASHAWAAWIGDQLALQGHPFSMVRWSPAPEAPLAGEYETLAADADRVVLLLDDWYFAHGGRTEEDWTSALRETVVPRLDRVTVVDVAGRELPHTAAALRPVGLLNLDEAEARRRLFAAMGLDTVAVETLFPDGSPPAHRCPNTPPAVWHAPRRNGRFTGRERYLEALHNHFIASRTGTVVAALQGAPGVGKTQIADEYVHRFGNEYDLVWYVNAAQRPVARQQFAELAERLGIAAGQQVGELIRLVQEELRVRHGQRRWLLVLDGAEDPGAVSELIPDGNGHVLLTTRREDWAEQGAEAFVVEPFERAESVEFVRRRAPRLTEAQAEQLATETEDFPLLLDQSAGWLEQSPTVDPGEYARLLREGRIAVEPGSGYPQSFDRAWTITFNALLDHDPASYQLLCLLAYFAPDTVPVRLLRTARRGDLPHSLGELIADPSVWNVALRRLREAAAVRIEYDNEPQRGDVLTIGKVRMHRLYQRLVRRNMSPGERREVSAAACRVLAAADPRDFSRANWSRYDELVPHLEDSGALVSDEREVHEFVLNCIEYLRVRGEYSYGLEVCQELVKHLRERLEPTDPRLLEAEQQHVNMLRRLGRYTDAVALGREVVEWLDSDPAARPVYRMRAQDSLAGSLLGIGRYEEAHELFEREAEEARATLGPTVPRTLFALSNLGVTQTLLGRYEQALATFREVLDERGRQLGDQHPRTLATTLKYARTLRLLGRYEKAVSVQQLNAQMHAQILDKHHEQTLHAEHNLALCLRGAGDAEYAEALLRSVVHRTRRKLGPQHPETLMVTADYAMLLRRHGDHDEAYRLADRTAQLYAAQLGEDHPYSIGTHGNTGLVRRGGRETPAALTIAEEALERMTAAVGESHPWTLGCALNALTARHLTGETEEAAELARELLPAAADALDGNHPLTMNVRASLAQFLFTLGDGQAGAKEYRRVVRQAAERYGEDHAFTRGIREQTIPTWDFEPQPL